MLELSIGRIWISQNASTDILDFEQPVYMFFKERIVCQGLPRHPFFRGQVGSFVEKLPWVFEVILVQAFLDKV